jgi:glyoxylase-like metal-dependent hydrolase (beta-lactamase superfamily II)
MTLDELNHSGYDGNTHTSGPAQTRLTSQLEITKVTVGPVGNNAYLLRDRTTGATLLIDAANEADRLIELCQGKLDGVLTTHCHADHWLALEAVVAATGATTYAGEAETEFIPAATSIVIRDGDSIVVGDTTLTAVTLTGHRNSYSDHISGSIALLFRDADDTTHLFSGDALFPGGLGNTAEDAAAFEQLFDDVTAKVFDQLPDDTWVYPGHGGDTTLGAERPHLAEWRERGW